jgi:hypothetical protein
MKKLLVTNFVAGNETSCNKKGKEVLCHYEKFKTDESSSLCQQKLKETFCSKQLPSFLPNSNHCHLARVCLGTSNDLTLDRRFLRPLMSFTHS